ncbi:pentatricopeptide repeat-containing protein At1g55630 [Beta vulgaris subsp. vulgaris]|uniref:pentatricopeptide repeat-containing protein At1g55630 n=1 Tax=Beta vulgaris subsp. vulgaris TaxID=3555 RepID=UPI0020374B4C|nr:pentatricopeptide repeat-containing protein At1g55630 [Beta vulgaris subsp. vulgaris]XP_048496126.1 pentatricopeptide repeat-containing protein At1g55630 [Beta vulgaris subsp. vulgaris]XP_057249538.1 pentatricopeptide repeat-containing protein At1g55630 [Beta vulgaris subsp. vulgaris]
MKSVAQFGRRVLNPIPFLHLVSRAFCNCSLDNGSDNASNSFAPIEKLIRESWASSDFDPGLDRASKEDESHFRGRIDVEHNFFERTMKDADRLFDVLRQDCPGFNVKLELQELNVRVSGLLVRQVLLKILKIINDENRTSCAKLAYKFFVWSSEHDYYRHTVNAYHLLMKIFAEAEEFKPMWRLVDEMTEKGYPTTARTFNIMVCSCRELGLRRTVVERFIRSKTFNYRPFKHSYNAILVCLLKINQHRLIEWVYQQMLADSHLPDTLTYNILICAQYRLGKMEGVHRLLDEMGRNGLSPDFHTFNILLHVLGKGDKPYAALNLLNHMREVGLCPSSLHFTTLIDGLSRAGNMDACKYFFDEMSKNGLKPDVVSYTVLISGYIAAGELEMAQQLFNDMIADGQLPNVFTYNSMIRGLCMAERFEDACSMLKEMETRGCSPNFLVYNTLIRNLRRNGKLSKAHEIVKDMIEKGQYLHRISRFKRYRRY